MKNKRFSLYVLLTGAGLLAVIAAGLFMFLQFRGTVATQNEFSEKLYDEYLNNISTRTLESMTQYLENKYPILQDKERVAAEAGAADWYWDMLEEWYEIQETFNFAYIYFMEKKGRNYLFILSTSIRKGETEDLIGQPIWEDDNMVPDFYGIAWETRQPTSSPEPFSDEWGTCIAFARPIVRGGETLGLLCVDYDISFLDTLVQQELLLQDRRNATMQKTSGILAVSFLAILAIMGYMVWLNNTSVLVSAQQKKVDERVQAVLNAMPMCSVIWNKNSTLIDCNEEALRMFEVPDKDNLIDNFTKLSPKYQPDGKRSKESALAHIKQAYEEGYCRAEWLHQKLNGEPIPCDVTLIRISLQNDFFIAGYVRDLRELNAAMESMRDANERVQILFDTSPAACCMFNKDFHIFDCNKVTVKMFGLPSKQTYLDRFYELSPEYQPCGRKTSDMVIENNAKTFAEGYNRFEWMHQTLSGEPLPCEIIHVRVKYRGEYVVAGYIRDLREQKALLNKLHEENERATAMSHWYGSILDTIPFPISVTDANMNWAFVNKTLVEYMGQNRDEILGQPCSNWQTAVCCSENCGVLRVKHGLKQTYFTQDGFSYQVDAEILTDLDGKTAGYVEVMQDVTKLEESTKKQVEAEAASLAKSAFLARVSHEVRTPMNAILGITEIQLQNEELPKDTQEAFGTIYNSGYLLLGIINDILDLSKIEAGKLELVPVNYDVASLINDTVHLNIMRYDSKPIDFMLQLDEKIPATLFGDDLRIKQVLNNLLSNSFKYTDSGTISFSIDAIPMEQADQVMLVFRISDTGQGMSIQQVEKLFDEYTRFNADANRSTVGTGLGMAITKHLIQLMDGEISVKSEPGQGSEFTVRLLQKKVDDGVLGKELVESLKSFQADKLSRFKKAPQIVREYMPYGNVLVVDDVETNLYVAKGLLAPYGLSIETASSGFEAVRKVKDGSSYDIIFLDHFMPKMDGMEAAKIIRELGYARPIIALTANALAGQAEVFMANGFDGFISKPIDIRQLNAALNKLVRDKYPTDVVEAARLIGDNLRKKSAASPAQPGITLELAGIFIRDAKRTIAALESIHGNHYRRADDIHIYVINVHAMKSALANIGEAQLSDFASKLEQAGREGNVAVMTEETPQFLEKLQGVINKLSPKEDSDDAEFTESDKAFLHEKLLALQEACAAYNKKASKAPLADLKEKKWPTEVRALLDTVSEHILHSDFEEAMEAVKEYMG